MVQTFAIFSDNGTRAAFYRSDAHAPAEIPPGVVEISEADWQAFLSGGQRWNGSGLEAYVPPSDVPNADEAVNAERDRRLELGVSYRGHVYQTREFDIANMTGAATAAVAAMMQGAQAGDLRWASTTTDFAWIDASNVAVTMDAPTLIGLAQAAMNRRAALILAARSIKDRLAAGATLTIGSNALWPT